MESTAPPRPFLRLSGYSPSCRQDLGFLRGFGRKVRQSGLHPVPVRLDFLMKEPDELFEKRKVLCSRNGVDFFDEPPFAFDDVDKVIDTKSRQRASGTLKGQKFVGFLRR